MRVYIVSSYEDIYGTFSSLEKAKKYASALIDKFGDFEVPFFSIDSIELDKELFEEADSIGDATRFEYSFNDHNDDDIDM